MTSEPLNLDESGEWAGLWWLLRPDGSHVNTRVYGPGCSATTPWVVSLFL